MCLCVTFNHHKTLLQWTWWELFNWQLKHCSVPLLAWKHSRRVSGITLKCGLLCPLCAVGGQNSADMILYNIILCNKNSKIMCTVYASILWFLHLKEIWNIWWKVCFSGVVVNVFVSVHLIWGVLTDKYWINPLQQWILWIPIKIHPHPMPTCTLCHHFKILFVFFNYYFWAMSLALAQWRPDQKRADYRVLRFLRLACLHELDALCIQTRWILSNICCHAAVIVI